MKLIDVTTLPVFSFGDTFRCTYCGHPAKTRDHVIAVSYQRPSRRKANSTCGPWCPCCNECNSHLYSHYFDTFEERCRFIQHRLELKAKPILWSIQETQHLDHNLRTYILNNRELRLSYRARADFFESRDFYIQIENLIHHCNNLLETTAGQFLQSYFQSTINQIKQTLYAVPVGFNI